jgi:hypothetical protein
MSASVHPATAAVSLQLSGPSIRDPGERADFGTFTAQLLPGVPSVTGQIKRAVMAARHDKPRIGGMRRTVEELERALDYPWEKWAVFLHPAQRRVVDRDCNGPARVSEIRDNLLPMSYLEPGSTAFAIV